MEHISVYLDRIRTHMLEESAQTDPGSDQDETPRIDEYDHSTEKHHNTIYC